MDEATVQVTSGRSMDSIASTQADPTAAIAQADPTAAIAQADPKAAAVPEKVLEVDSQTVNQTSAQQSASYAQLCKELLKANQELLAEPRSIRRDATSLPRRRVADLEQAMNAA